MRLVLGFIIVIVLCFLAAAVYWAMAPKAIRYVAPEKTEGLPSVLLETTTTADAPIDLTPAQ